MNDVIEYLTLCKGGKHQYVTIYNGDDMWNDDEYLIIHWCKRCGSINKCYEYDGRFSRTIDFKVPQVSKDISK